MHGRHNTGDRRAKVGHEMIVRSMWSGLELVILENGNVIIIWRVRSQLNGHTWKSSYTSPGGRTQTCARGSDAMRIAY